MLSEIVTGITVGVVLTLMALLAKKFTEVIILKRDLATMWRKFEQLEKQVIRLDESQDSLKTKIAVLEATRKA